jgi:hypothetical protein
VPIKNPKTPSSNHSGVTTTASFFWFGIKQGRTNTRRSSPVCGQVFLKLHYSIWTELPSWLWTKTTISKVHTIYWKGRQVIKQHIIIYFNLIYEYFLADLSVLARAWVFPFLFFFFFFNFPLRASDRWQKAWTLFKHEAIDSE